MNPIKPLVLTLLAVAVLGSQCLAAPTYHIRELGTLPGMIASEAEAINDRGQVAGYMTFQETTGYVYHAVVWNRDGSIIQLGQIGPGVSAFANDINNNGVVVGYSAASTLRATLWSASGAATDIGPAGDVSSAATGINDLGEISGSTGGITPQAIIWSAAGVFSNVNAEQAYDINSSGQLAIEDSADKAVFLDGATRGTSSVPSGFGSAWGLAINSGGDVAGTWYSPIGDGLPTRAFLRSASGQTTDIGFLSGGNYSYGYGVNDAGCVVGESGWEQDRGFLFNRGFVWNAADGITDLGSLPGYGWSCANDINASGTIVGYATGGMHYSRAVIWTVPEPGSILCLLVGLAGCLRRRRR